MTYLDQWCGRVLYQDLKQNGYINVSDMLEVGWGRLEEDGDRDGIKGGGCGWRWGGGVFWGRAVGGRGRDGEINYCEITINIKAIWSNVSQVQTTPVKVISRYKSFQGRI